MDSECDVVGFLHRYNSPRGRTPYSRSEGTRTTGAQICSRRIAPSGVKSAEDVGNNEPWEGCPFCLPWRRGTATVQRHRSPQTGLRARSPRARKNTRAPCPQHNCVDPRCVLVIGDAVKTCLFWARTAQLVMMRCSKVFESSLTVSVRGVVGSEPSVKLTPAIRWGRWGRRRRFWSGGGVCWCTGLC